MFAWHKKWYQKFTNVGDNPNCIYGYDARHICVLIWRRITFRRLIPPHNGPAMPTFDVLCWTSGWTNSRCAGDLRRHNTRVTSLYWCTFPRFLFFVGNNIGGGSYRVYLPRLPWIFPGAPLKINGAPGNIQGNLTGMLLRHIGWLLPWSIGRASYVCQH